MAVAGRGECLTGACAQRLVRDAVAERDVVIMFFFHITLVAEAAHSIRSHMRINRNLA